MHGRRITAGLWHMYWFNKPDNEGARHFFEMAVRARSNLRACTGDENREEAFVRDLAPTTWCDNLPLSARRPHEGLLSYRRSQACVMLLIADTRKAYAGHP
jgi:hypothetical protein